MTPEQIKTAEAVERALKRAVKCGLKLYAYTDFGLYISDRTPNLIGGVASNEAACRRLEGWQKLAYELPINALGDGGAGV